MLAKNQYHIASSINITLHTSYIVYIYIYIYTHNHAARWLILIHEAPIVMCIATYIASVVSVITKYVYLMCACILIA